MNDRIKLAEAMGWTPSHESKEKVWIGPDTKAGEYGDYFSFEQLPDPENDANDDYAVLEWVRTNPEGFGVFHDGKWMGWTTFMHMNEQEAHQYHIGDWAQAALVSLEITPVPERRASDD